MKAQTKELFDFEPDPKERPTGDPDWLGMIIDNRQLFDALQDGWLRPTAPQEGMIVGVESFSGTAGPFANNRIPVWLRLETAKLPDIEVNVLQSHQWHALPLSQVRQPKSLVLWPGVMPTSSIRNITVACDEHRIRLQALAKRASNILVPDDVACGAEPSAPIPPIPPLPDPGTSVLRIPEIEDRIRGAMTLALWAVPKIDPWLDLLVTSLSGESDKLTSCAQHLHASWWRFPPWSRLVRKDAHNGTTANDAQEALWLGAIGVFGAGHELRSVTAADAITEMALLHAASEEQKREILEWQRATHRIQRAGALIQHDAWRRMPIGIAIQLLLARPDPDDFKTWLHGDDQPSPAVTWTAATLCGLLHGYRRLNVAFRGSSAQQEVVAIQALRMSTEQKDLAWPNVTQEAPCWRKEHGISNRYIVSWGGRDVVEKTGRERGQWFTVDFDDPDVQREAATLAKQMEWDCVRKVLELDAGVRRLRGPGRLKHSEGCLQADGRISIELAACDRIEERVCRAPFLRMVAVERGRLPAPPSTDPCDAVDGEMSGFALVHDFISEAEEKELVRLIDDAGQWSTELARRTQHYGWRYDYRSRRIDDAARIGPLPDWAEKLAERLFQRGLVPNLPDQMIVNEYVKSQGVSPHVDSGVFTDGVAMISLLESWEMEFSKGQQKRMRRLERRSAVVLTGDARYLWKHGIRTRRSEPPAKGSGSRKRIPRGRRISLTFRKVLATEY